ncbi:replicative DNA helicase [Orientia tsutsugamushi]|uniref:Replicative DNA helicase n=1 Tax=Orientia tsutsugamushi TaxID=784 RepID=A0A2U3RPH6_ORITS|nr:hypothetical protein OTSKARP_1554 [Orientia tsutsugamushi str. Karp]KJV75011.1 hypothetical protein OTSTA763_0752 [Orientia tsutsugamushi str. TA763]SPP26443.1 replicative DNA helicase [Orientia tsutsugamushi]SPR15131.1 replicative DNA helicase [Orientia tsutsugamushi]
MPEIKLNLRPNLLRLFRYLSAIILNYINQFRQRSIQQYNINSTRRSVALLVKQSKGSIKLFKK